MTPTTHDQGDRSGQGQEGHVSSTFMVTIAIGLPVFTVAQIHWAWLERPVRMICNPRDRADAARAVCRTSPITRHHPCDGAGCVPAGLWHNLLILLTCAGVPASSGARWSSAAEDRVAAPGSLIVRVAVGRP